MSNTQEDNQKQLQLALVRGEKVTGHPDDLFIPPDALEVFLETFEGPLDFLLYLIKKQKFDIVDLPIAEITAQYMEYVDLMKDLNLELAGEYLVMAAILAEIKSRILLPVNKESFEDESDPRAELVRQLLEYEKFKQGAEQINSLPLRGRDMYAVSVKMSETVEYKDALPDINIADLTDALINVLNKAKNFTHHQIKRESLSTRERMTKILSITSNTEEFVQFGEFFSSTEGRSGVVVTFLAILELVKESAITLTQSGPFAPIYVKRTAESAFDLERVS